MYYFGKIADAASDLDRERYLSALIGRLKLSGDVGLLHKDDADRLIDNIPSDLDIFKYNREYANDPALAQRLLLNGAYPNMRPELREELQQLAGNTVTTIQNPPATDPATTDHSVPSIQTASKPETKNEVSKRAPRKADDKETTIQTAPEPEQKETSKPLPPERVPTLQNPPATDPATKDHSVPSFENPQRYDDIRNYPPLLKLPGDDISSGSFPEYQIVPPGFVVKQGEPKDEGDPKRQDKADTIDDLLGALKNSKKGI
ncbi:MAG TPA: hypothetical protein VGH16_16290 [Candidatus Binatia bacterium]